MIIVLIIASIGIIIYGYLLMQRIDSFFERRGSEPLAAACMQKDILLLGSAQTLQRMCPALEAARISFDCTDQPNLSAPTAYRWAGAFSDSDLDNLQFCLCAKREQKDICTMAICNNATYKNVYKQMGITQILHQEVSGELLLARLKGHENVCTGET